MTQTPNTQNSQIQPVSQIASAIRTTADQNAALGQGTTYLTQAQLNQLVEAELLRLTDQTAPQEFTAFTVALNLRTALGLNVDVPHRDNQHLTGIRTLVHTAMLALIGQHPQYYWVDFDSSIGPNGAHVYKPGQPAQVTTVTVAAPTLQADSNTPATPATPTSAPALASVNPIRWDQ